MTDSPTDRPVAATRRQHPLRFELILASALLGFGLFVLPGIIYWVGTQLLGPYGERGGLGAFYGDFYGDLASGVVRAWILALAPLVLVFLLRLIFLTPRTSDAEPEDTADVAPQHKRTATSSDSRRVEPRVSLD
jgi:hypothetical protein